MHHTVRRRNGSLKSFGRGEGLDWADSELVVDVYDEELTPELADTYAAELTPDPETPEEQARSALRQWARQQIQSAVGVRAPDLTAGQVKALLLALLVQAGAIDGEGYVRPPGEWI